MTETDLSRRGVLIAAAGLAASGIAASTVLASPASAAPADNFDCGF